MPVNQPWFARQFAHAQSLASAFGLSINFDGSFQGNAGANPEIFAYLKTQPMLCRIQPIGFLF